MSTFNYYKDNNWNEVGGISEADTLPIGSVVEYDGTEVPDGYIEISEMSGSNANGSWVKFADGTMICRQNINTGSVSISSSWGNLYIYSNTDIHNFPQTFIDVPTISIDTGNITGSIGYWLADYGNRVVTNSYWKGWALVRPDSGTVNTTLNVIAIGRWK